LTTEMLAEVDSASRCTEDDLADLRAFKARMHGETSRLLDQARADWLFWRNPFRTGDPPTIWICRRDGKVVGTEAGIPFDLLVDGRHCRASWAVELVVDPEWRGRGVGAALSEAHRQACQVSGFLNVSTSGHRLLVRRQSTDIGHIPMYFRLVDGRGILHWEGVPRDVRFLARPLIAPALWILDAAGRMRGARTELVPVETFDQRADSLWQTMAGHYPVIARRDATWLRWRFDECPDRDHYLRYYVVHRRRLIGYLVLRRTTWSGCEALEIVDYLAAPRDMARLLGSGVRVARQLGVAALLCNTLNPRARSAFRSRGFLRRRNQGIRFFAFTSDAPLLGDIQNPAKWFVTSADSDLD
jgi:GNAT superfamily N-acetyltransferase